MSFWVIVNWPTSGLVLGNRLLFEHVQEFREKSKCILVPIALIIIMKIVSGAPLLQFDKSYPAFNSIYLLSSTLMAPINVVL